MGGTVFIIWKHLRSRAAETATVTVATPAEPRTLAFNNGELESSQATVFGIQTHRSRNDPVSQVYGRWLCSMRPVWFFLLARMFLVVNRAGDKMLRSYLTILLLEPSGFTSLLS